MMEVVHHYQLLQRDKSLFLSFFFFFFSFTDLKMLLEVYSFKSETSYCFIGATVVLNFFTEGEVICEFSDYIIKNSGGI